MKRILCVILVFVILISAQYIGYAEANSVQIAVDGTVLDMNPGAKIMNNGSTYVPLTLFAKSSAFNAEIKLGTSSTTNDYIIDRKAIGRIVEIHENNGVISEIIVNGRKKAVNVPVVHENGQLWVPIVFLVEQLGGQATWSQLTRRVMVDSFKPVVFNDKKLESAVRIAAGIAQGSIFKSDLDLVDNLAVPNSGVIDLEGIQYLTNLARLDLSNNSITNVTPLRPLRKLNTLYLNGNKIGDFSPLSDMYDQLSMKDFSIKVSIYDPNLEVVIRTEIGKVNGELTLKDLKSITVLHLENKGISDLQGIQYLTGLKELHLGGNKITIIEPVKNLIDLEVLSLNKNSIENIKPLAYLKNLSQLDLTGNKISDLSPLSELVKLKQLGLIENKVVNINKLSGLINLEVLILQNNEISDISGLYNLVNLKELWLGQNKVSNISSIGILVNLEFLVLKNNQISDVSGLRRLVNLKELYLNGNPVTDYSPLKDLCKNLIKLDFPNPNSGQLPTGSATPSPTVSAVVSPTATPAATSGITATPAATSGITTTPAATSTASPATSPDVIGERVIRFYIDKPFYYVNDKRADMDVAPIIKTGRTFLPARYVTESLGGSVIWNDKEKKISVILGTRNVEMLLNSDLSSVNGTPKVIDVPPFVEKGRTLVPFRFLSEALGCEVNWDPDIRCVTLYNSEYAANHPEKFVK